MSWRIGDPFRACDTQEIRDSNIVPGTPGRIEGINGSKISFFIEKSHPKQGFTEGNASLGIFSSNFAPDKAKESCRRQRLTSNLYSNEFPSDWVRPSGLAS